MPRYKVVGGTHRDKDQVPHLPGEFYDPTAQELEAFPGRFEFAIDDVTSQDVVVTAEPIAELMEHLTKTAIFIEKTNPGVVLKAIGDGRFTAKEALAAEMFGLERPELVASLEAVIEGRIEAHPDNILTIEDLLALEAVEGSLVAEGGEDVEDDQPFNVTAATVEQVLERVAEGDIAADVALALERGRAEPRKTLLAKLEAMLE